MERPKIKLQLSPLDRKLNLISNAILTLLWLLTVFSFFKLPDQIPTHFNSNGETDNYGDKDSIFTIPIVATILFIGLTVLNKFPEIFNYPEQITKTNAEHQYSNATSTVRFLKLIITSIFTIITVLIIISSINRTKGLGLWFLPIILLLIFIPTIFYFIKIATKK